MRLTLGVCVLGLCTGAFGFIPLCPWAWPWYKEVCYNADGIGCFNNAIPNDYAMCAVPESPKDIQIEFRLFTLNNTNSYQIVNKTPLSILKSFFRGTKKTKFIIHGFQATGNDPWVINMKKEILIQKKEDVNVFVVDWSKGADDHLSNYTQAAANTRVVGALIAQFITQLHNTPNVKYGDFHLIGHSLGAHVAGFAGDKRPGLGRITGLDPAGVMFENNHPMARLDPTDAVFVDAIHTDAIGLGIGIRQTVGHVDYFPNGGGKQPGCGGWWTVATDCSHTRVFDLFIESINSTCLFKSYPCSSRYDFNADKCKSCGTGCANMGYNSQRPRDGTYYLSTRENSPYCKG